MRNAVGFYWTLPVPWAGFTTLPDDIDAAAKVSRTIQYQCELIRRYAKANNVTLVAEKVFLEIAPDRGSQYVLDALRPLEAICQAKDAVLLHVDFSEVQGWRSHGPLSDWARHARIEVATVYPDELQIDGEVFDPHHHFAAWRKRQHDWTAGKSERLARALAAAGRLRDAGRTHNAIARAMNDEGIPSATGKLWTADSIRKLLDAAPD
ncbi:MAG: hypothetical protein P3W94_008770 [Paracoccus sp. (in: a-proteobacteria)]|nr:hypothetical protein [Paracoccus sp. (in: a-proteobacteria)]